MFVLIQVYSLVATTVFVESKLDTACHGTDLISYYHEWSLFHSRSHSYSMAAQNTLIQYEDDVLQLVNAHANEAFSIANLLNVAQSETMAVNDNNNNYYWYS